jgi:hypothetical protein
MSSKPEPKDVHQLNGTGPTPSPSSSDGPGREPLAGTSEFLGPDGAGVEVVVIESRANAKGVREEDALLENGSQSNESDDVSTDHGPAPPSPLKETSFSIGLQVLFPFLLAGFGTVAAGMVLDIVQVGPKSDGFCWEPVAIFASWGTMTLGTSSSPLCQKQLLLPRIPFPFGSCPWFLCGLIHSFLQKLPGSLVAPERWSGQYCLIVTVLVPELRFREERGRVAFHVSC